MKEMKARSIVVEVTEQMTKPSAKDIGFPLRNSAMNLGLSEMNDLLKDQKDSRTRTLLTKLAQKAADGDRDALEALFEHEEFQRRLNQICQWVYHNYKPRENYYDWEDLRQDVTHKLLRKIQQFKGQSSIVTYINRIAINIYRSHLRRLRLANGYLETQQLTSTAESACADMDLQVSLRLAISRLIPRQQHVLRRRIEGITLEQIAQELSCSVATAYALLKQAEKQLVKVCSK
jgi:RNA polymerase sigma factor (sigma-70 family)